MGCGVSGDESYGASPDAWNGHKARLMPSGSIHRVEWVRWSGGVWGMDQVTTTCGRQAQRRRFTTHFPPEGRHCPECFPPASDGAA